MSDVAGFLTAPRAGAADLATLRKAISARLGLGGAPDVVTNDACRALLVQAQTQGGEQRLRMLLATLFFLVETEHAPRIDLALVQRATELQPSAAPIRATAKHAANRNVFPFAAAASLAVIAVGYGAFYMAHRGAAFHNPESGPIHALPEAAPNTGPSPHMAAQIARSPARPVPPQPVTTPTAVALAPPATQHLQPPVAPHSPPQSTPGDWQPAPPAPTLRLRFSVLTHATPARARFIVQQLEQSGFKVDAAPDYASTRYPTASLRYFYKQDRDLALRVASAAQTRAQPKLVAAGDAAPPPPGTIELYLP